MNNTIKHDGGFLVWREASGGTIEIVDIDAGHNRRCGVGKAMLETLFREVGSARRVFAITRTTNEVAVQWYQAMGFEVIGVLRRFYGGPGVDAIMFGRSAGGPV